MISYPFPPLNKHILHKNEVLATALIRIAHEQSIPWYPNKNGLTQALYYTLEMHKNAAKILIVFFYPTIKGFDVFLIKEPQDLLL